MGALTRLDCALGTAGLMRQALSLALHHTTQRHAFGRPLIAQPLMQNVLADLALESEAATALALRLARGGGPHRPRPPTTHEAVMRRLLTPVAKFWICKRGSHFAQEAMECLGGNGYVEAAGEGVMARIYREMPVNSIWEGAGNIMAIDLLRALRGADVLPALERELAPARGAHAGLRPRRDGGAATPWTTACTRRRRASLARDLALVLQAALLHRQAPAAGLRRLLRLAPGGHARCLRPAARRHRPRSAGRARLARTDPRQETTMKPSAGRHRRHHRRRLGLRPRGQPHRGARWA